MINWYCSACEPRELRPPNIQCRFMACTKCGKRGYCVFIYEKEPAMDIKTTVVSSDVGALLPKGEKITGRFLMQFDNEPPIEISKIYNGGRVTLDLEQNGCIEFKSDNGRTFKIILIE